jgi:hypothetical protein
MQVRILQGFVVLLCAAAVVAKAAEEFVSDTFDGPGKVKLVAVSSDGGATYEDLYVAQQQPPATGQTPGAPRTTTPTPAPNATPTQPRVPPARPTPDANALAQVSPNNFGMPNGASRSQPGYSLASTPHMIGDTLGPQFQYLAFVPRQEKVIPVGTVAMGGGNRSVKISDDCSPFPVDRVFFDYNNFHNALLTANGELIDLNQYTIGLEKTFFDGICSLQIKAPFLDGLNNSQDLFNSTEQNEGSQFGRLSLTPKLLLHQSDLWASSIGMAIGLPTSPDSTFNAPFNAQIEVLNQSVHLAPFVGFLVAPNPKIFSITYLQLDFDVNGNMVQQGGIDAGTVRDPTLFYVDTSIGYWLFGGQPERANYLNWMTGVAPMIELHYTEATEDAVGIPGIIEPAGVRPRFFNLTAGVFFQMGRLTSLFVGGVAPLKAAPEDREFDSEFVLQFNRRF